ncbi:hypothetical protein Ga0466249_002776 [Sporomusaceae bacterium BoRhaA]|uniref:hypothetical protein n=1 Tax=Pelorhabdus rhamnosifermentans TaxID=2772457 RepID=UPI001C0613C7|nr:hypothetical protein [Pelorhabdus rhamnosifermentans]MBU2701657.1 hypothetical protein [Pelorhabdus rhamnosifermentans]
MPYKKGKASNAVRKVYKSKKYKKRISSLRSCPAKVSSDGTILKPFLIEGGRYIVEVNLDDGFENVTFSIRGVVDYKGLSDVLRSAEKFLSKTISGSKHSGNC